MRTIMLPDKKVEDVAGLYYDLIKNGFEVENVGLDQKGVHVFLNDMETKDPTSVVEAWVGKPAPVTTRSLVEQRKAMVAEYQAKRSEREAEARAKAAAMAQAEDKRQAASGVPAPAPIQGMSGSKATLFSKIFRKLW